MSMAPQKCPGCKTSLKDPSVPLDKLKYRRQFTLALVDLDVDDGWICPFCDHRWVWRYP